MTTKTFRSNGMELNKHTFAREDAARAMLAALESIEWIVEMAVDDDRFAPELKAVRRAIAAAKAAGIKAEG